MGPSDYSGREWRYRHQIFIFFYYLRLVFVIRWKQAPSLSYCLHTYIFSEFSVTIWRRKMEHIFLSWAMSTTLIIAISYFVSQIAQNLVFYFLFTSFHLRYYRKRKWKEKIEENSEILYSKTLCGEFSIILHLNCPRKVTKNFFRTKFGTLIIQNSKIRDA